jgi:chemotaxis protein MotB
MLLQGDMRSAGVSTTRFPPLIALAALVLGGCATTRSDLELSTLRGQLRDQEARCASREAQASTSLDDLGATSLALSSGLKEQIARGQVTIDRLQDRLKVSVVQELLFDSGHADLREGASALLDTVATAIQGIPGRPVTIEGHTDNVPIGPSILDRYPTNWELSTARATTVVRYLQDQGVQPRDLGAAGFGEYRPVASNDSLEGRQKNRRIDVILGAASAGPARQAAAAPGR